MTTIDRFTTNSSFDYACASDSVAPQVPSTSESALASESILFRMSPLAMSFIMGELDVVATSDVEAGAAADVVGVGVGTNNITGSSAAAVGVDGAIEPMSADVSDMSVGGGSEGGEPVTADVLDNVVGGASAVVMSVDDGIEPMLTDVTSHVTSGSVGAVEIDNEMESISADATDHVTGASDATSLGMPNGSGSGLGGYIVTEEDRIAAGRAEQHLKSLDARSSTNQRRRIINMPPAPPPPKAALTVVVAKAPTPSVATSEPEDAASAEAVAQYLDQERRLSEHMAAAAAKHAASLAAAKQMLLRDKELAQEQKRLRQQMRDRDMTFGVFYWKVRCCTLATLRAIQLS